MKNFILIIQFLSCICGSVALAQADHIGSGGDWSEADLKHFLSRLVPYLQSEEGRKVFPEVGQYDQAHGEEIVEKVAGELNPRLVNQPVYDSSGNERDCVSYTKPLRYFECNLNSLPRKPTEGATEAQKSEYFGSMYRLVLHEVFVQVGIEKPLTKEIPSEYTYSSHLMVHLETFPEWVPGPAPYEKANQSDIVIHSHPEWSVGVELGGLLHTVGTGLNLQLQFPVTIGLVEFKFGIATGFDYGFSSPYRSWAIPIFATFHYQFPQIKKLHPYFKAGVGVIISHQDFDFSGDFAEFNIDTHSYGPTVHIIASDTDTDTNLSFLITPGFYFGSKDQYFFEVPIRTLGDPQGMSIMPTVGMHF